MGKEIKRYFEEPTQVIFHETDEDNDYLGGIAWGDKIICGCCGGVIDTIDCNYIKELEWIEISDEIMGDEALDIIENEDEIEEY